MSQLVILSPMACIFFKRRQSVGEGYTREEAHEIIGLGCQCKWMWAGTDAFVAAYVVMLGEARHILVKAREFIRKQRLQRLTSPKSTAVAPMAPCQKSLRNPPSGRKLSIGDPRSRERISIGPRSWRPDIPSICSG